MPTKERAEVNSPAAKRSYSTAQQDSTAQPGASGQQRRGSGERQRRPQEAGRAPRGSGELHAGQEVAPVFE
eukprot:8097492-Lingulodinium_polyedra.AAC.1